MGGGRGEQAQPVRPAEESGPASGGGGCTTLQRMFASSNDHWAVRMHVSRDHQCAGFPRPDATFLPPHSWPPVLMRSHATFHVRAFSTQPAARCCPDVGRPAVGGQPQTGSSAAMADGCPLGYGQWKEAGHGSADGLRPRSSPLHRWLVWSLLPAPTVWCAALLLVAWRSLDQSNPQLVGFRESLGRGC